ncbi:MAG: hypothetical protein KTR13_00010 [Saprospiraceae bacterium]|nr:hypothetical protein [Saprospiraceae bacterium]
MKVAVLFLCSMKKILSPRFLSVWLLYTFLFALGKLVLDGVLTNSGVMGWDTLWVSLAVGLVFALFYTKFFPLQREK